MTTAAEINRRDRIAQNRLMHTPPIDERLLPEVKTDEGYVLMVQPHKTEHDFPRPVLVGLASTAEAAKVYCDGLNSYELVDDNGYDLHYYFQVGKVIC